MTFSARSPPVNATLSDGLSGAVTLGAAAAGVAVAPVRGLGGGSAPPWSPEPVEDVAGSGSSCCWPPEPGWRALGSLLVGFGSFLALHAWPPVPGRTAAIRGLGLESAVAFSENDQPSKPPLMKSRFLTPHWL
ncbi:hypothetical protein Psuf_065980 [Phytohabitans suffuscus]|uniref:Uncharacterized protein n=1 Tax=Phytohabitans suffuscus TaxID=624315 RepID=A0A6F8YSX8_9ACTN|nr:hypothetical protein Psuf_065980 [Phytohabitans suffuscus]